MTPAYGPYVKTLRAAGVETFESCQGGEGHALPEPVIRFYGGRGEGFRALAIVLDRALPVRAVRRAWTIDDGEPTGPHWEMSFYRGATDLDS